jgi:hypothetical protein
VSLQNVLPYPGIEEVLEVHVIEMSVTTMQRFTHTVTVGDNSRSFKATLVWMDPTNSAVAAKTLINNLDLQVEETSTGTVYYGNGNGGDDTNNVEQVAISVPSTSGSYKVRVTAGSYLYGSSQSFSLIISGGNLTFTSDVMATTNAYNPLDCATNQRLVRMTAMDRQANGWTSGAKYRITGNSASIEGTMSGSDKEDFITTRSMCLEVGSYSVSLLNPSSPTDFSEMAFEVDTCNVYLSEYQTSSSFSIGSSTSSYCGTCPTYQISLLLAGSFYGVPYGWSGNSHYVLKQTKGGDATHSGTLATGMLREHRYCLDSGTYSLYFRGVPTSDDFLDDDYLANYVGKEEYTIYVSDSAGNDFMLTEGLEAVLTVDASTATYIVAEADDSGDEKSAISPVVLGIIIAVVVVIILCVIGAIWYSYKIGGAKVGSSAGGATPVNPL